MSILLLAQHVGGKTATAELTAGNVDVHRPTARPLPDHPGNVFLAGEDVVVPTSAQGGATWQLVDYDGQAVTRGTAQGGKARLGRLPVGYYDLRQGEAATTIGVLAPLQAPVPQSSPIAVDLAMSWFYHTTAEKAAAANLCKLAGITWVRDRMTWGEIEPSREQFLRSTRYDDSARLQSEAGLHVLQVDTAPRPGRAEAPSTFRKICETSTAFSATPPPAGKAGSRPSNRGTRPTSTCSAVIRAEMASLQKAAYLGLKSGNPEAIACLNVFAIARPDTLDDLAANTAWPYFDTCNLHHYIRPDDYPAWYAAFRQVSAGRPLWVTQLVSPLVGGDSKAQEPTAADQRLQAHRVPIVFVSSLHEGPAEAFYFLFPTTRRARFNSGSCIAISRRVRPMWPWRR